MRKTNPAVRPHSNTSYIYINTAIPFQLNIINKLNIIATAIALSLSAAPDKALAACAPTAADGVTTVCDASSVHTTTVGTGPGLNNAAIDVQPSAHINSGEVSAISLDSNSAITLQDGAVVQNDSHDAAGSGLWGMGQSTIEFNHNTTLTIERGAQVLGLGAGPNNTVAVRDSANTIVNHGLIQSQSGYAVFFSTAAVETGGNTLDNYGTISATTPENIAVYGSFSGIDLINHSGGIIIGSIKMGSNSDHLTLEAGSVLDSETIDGGGGVNALILTAGAAGSSQTVSTLSAIISNFLTLTKNGGSEWQITSPIVGLTNVSVNDGTLTLTGQNTYSGATGINGGTLAAGAAGALSPNSAFTLAAPGTLNLMGFDQTISSVNNAGTININGAGGTVLNVTGNYSGNNGHLNFNAELSGDAANTERLDVGGSTAGTTLVSVNNAGGSGAATVNGIKLISVNGASDGEFVQSGRIVAGAYEYALERGTGDNAANWYLNSSTAEPGPEEPGQEPQPIPDPHPAPDTMVERPEAAGYAANLAAANTLFATRLADRQGMTRYVDPITGEQKTTSLWMTNEGGHNRSRDDSGQLRTQTNRYVLQLGGDIGRWSSNTQDSVQLGAMAGYGNARSNTGSRVSGYRSTGSVDGYSVGVYGTWYANAADKSGLYLDGWTQYGWFDNQVDGRDLAHEDYRSKGFTASLETGYTVNIGENPAKNAGYFIQPQAQAIWMDVKADDHTEANGTRVTGDGDGNIQTRLGIKAFMNAYSERDKDKDRRFQPFIEANWIHNSDAFGATLDGVEIKQAGAANIGELKLGVEGQLNKNVTLWGNVSQQVGNNGYSDTAGMLGVKYLF